jgi:BirA family biotin operon repressor/biotin-[acetyl-CoA-carboxylase] ligase
MVRRAVRAVAGIEIGLKWPNDLVVDGGKLGGILVELDRLEGGDVHVVAGIGINVRVRPDYLAAVSDWSEGARDLAGATGGARIDRSLLAAALIEAMSELFGSWSEQGFAAYRAEWLAAHVLENAAVELRSVGDAMHGTVRGVDVDGALVVEDAAGRRQRFVSGEITVRARP